MNLADSHYRALETKGQEPIDRMEAIVCRGIPEEFHEIARRNLNMALASKHEDRAGEKSGEDWRKELTKAQNYMHRAVHGCWIGKGASDKESLTVRNIAPFAVGAVVRAKDSAGDVFRVVGDKTLRVDGVRPWPMGVWYVDVSFPDADGGRCCVHGIPSDALVTVQ